MNKAQSLSERQSVSLGSRERQVNKALQRSAMRAGTETCKKHSSQMGTVVGRLHRKLDLN